MSFMTDLSFEKQIIIIINSNGSIFEGSVIAGPYYFATF